MSEFIGSRISLISKSDIRYVGTLHEINSETSTVALETVKSFGTEGRKNDPEDEIAGSDNIYEYIVFRGSDVKDLRIEEPPKENKPPAPQVPNDPAILGSARPQGPNGQGQQMPPGGPRGTNFPPGPGFPPNQYRPYGGPPGGPPSGPGFGPPGGGFPPYGPPPGHFGGPPGWHGGPPPPGAPGFPGGPGHFNGPFSPQHQQNLSFGGPGPEQLTHQRQQPSQGPENPQGPPQAPTQAERGTPVQKPDGPNKPPTGPAANRSNGGQAPQNQAGPPPPNASKPNPAAAMAPAGNKPAAQKPNRIMPAVPLATPGSKQAPKYNAVAANAAIADQQKQPQAASNAAMQNQNATTQAATAAVAAAMAKLNNPAAGVPMGAVDNLTQKVNEMRVDERSRTNDRGSGRGRGGRRGGRGGARGIDVPESDFDFESANAKFDKSNLAKGTTSASVTSPGADGAGDATESEEVVIPPAEPAYSKDSFFDSLSREDTESGRRMRGGREFRQEDRKMNLETFGMSSVDYGRGGFRGRGRGRGYGRGAYGRGRGRGRGGLGASEASSGF